MPPPFELLAEFLEGRREDLVGRGADPWSPLRVRPSGPNLFARTAMAFELVPFVPRISGDVQYESDWRILHEGHVIVVGGELLRHIGSLATKLDR